MKYRWVYDEEIGGLLLGVIGGRRRGGRRRREREGIEQTVKYCLMFNIWDSKIFSIHLHQDREKKVFIVVFIIDGNKSSIF